MANIILRKPKIEELHYRQTWLKDEKTMSYNSGYDLDLKGYNKETGTINKTKDELIEWYHNWTNKEPHKYFAYIYDKTIEEPVGEIYYYLNNDIHSVGILIQHKYRGRGYSYQALLELEKIAFEKNNINELSDFIPIERVGAIKSFQKAGFISTNKYREDLVFNKISKSKQLLITKDMYFKKNSSKFSIQYSLKIKNTI